MQSIEHSSKDKDNAIFRIELGKQFPSIIVRNRTRKHYAYAASKY